MAASSSASAKLEEISSAYVELVETVQQTAMAKEVKDPETLKTIKVSLNPTGQQTSQANCFPHLKVYVQAQVRIEELQKKV